MAGYLVFHWVVKTVEWKEVSSGILTDEKKVVHSAYCSDEHLAGSKDEMTVVEKASCLVGLTDWSMAIHLVVRWVVLKAVRKVGLMDDRLVAWWVLSRVGQLVAWKVVKMDVRWVVSKAWN